MRKFLSFNTSSQGYRFTQTESLVANHSLVFLESRTKIPSSDFFKETNINVRTHSQVPSLGQRDEDTGT